MTEDTDASIDTALGGQPDASNEEIELPECCGVGCNCGEECDCCDASATNNPSCKHADLPQTKRYCKIHRGAFYGPKCIWCVQTTMLGVLVQIRNATLSQLPRLRDAARTKDPPVP